LTTKTTYYRKKILFKFCFKLNNQELKLNVDKANPKYYYILRIYRPKYLSKNPIPNRLILIKGFIFLLIENLKILLINLLIPLKIFIYY